MSTILFIQYCNFGIDTQFVIPPFYVYIFILIKKIQEKINILLSGLSTPILNAIHILGLIEKRGGFSQLANSIPI